MDEAVICPGCGCPTNNYTSQLNAAKTIHSNDYPAIQRFAEQAKPIKVLGIFAAVLMFGIGFIFSIIIWIKSSGIIAPEVTTTNPDEIAELEEAKRNLNLGRRLAGFPIAAIGISIFLGILLVPIFSL